MNDKEHIFPDEVDISPNSRVYGAFRNLNYNFWNAIAEYIDNSIHSFEKNLDSLKKINENYKLCISIEINNNSISIEDNAAGVDLKNFERAFKLAERPSETGLSEFGLGMKTASFWLCDNWKIISKNFNSEKEFSLEFDNKEIVENDIKKLFPKYKDINNNSHYTKILLKNIRHLDPNTHSISNKKIEKLKKFLISTYRYYFRYDLIKIKFKVGDNDYEILKFKEPKYLNASTPPNYKVEDKKLWKKNIDFHLNSGKKVSGFVGILETGKASEAGFVFLRKNRVIEGALKGIRKEEIHSTDNKQQARRLIGEFNLNDFEVSHTKDKILFSHEDDEFIMKLKENIGDEFLKQAKDYSITKDPNSSKFKGDINNNSSKANTNNENNDINPTSKNDGENVNNDDNNNSNQENSNDTNSPNNTNSGDNRNEKPILDFEVPEEEKIELGKKLLKSSNDMSKSYKEMFLIENLLRSLIIHVESKYDENFLIKYEDKINDKKLEETKNHWLPRRGNHGVFYLDFIELKKIICDDHYSYFKEYFPEHGWIKQRILDFYKYRNLIAHNNFLPSRVQKIIYNYTEELKNHLSKSFQFKN